MLVDHLFVRLFSRFTAMMFADAMPRAAGIIHALEQNAKRKHGSEVL